METNIKANLQPWRENIEMWPSQNSSSFWEDNYKQNIH